MSPKRSGFAAPAAPAPTPRRDRPPRRLVTILAATATYGAAGAAMAATWGVKNPMVSLDMLARHPAHHLDDQALAGAIHGLAEAAWTAGLFELARQTRGIARSRHSGPSTASRPRSGGTAGVGRERRDRVTATDECSSQGGLGRAKLRMATLGGVVSGGAGSSRRGIDQPRSSKRHHRERVDMSHPESGLEDNGSRAEPSKAAGASVLATTALLGARRRWIQLAHESSAETTIDTAQSSGRAPRFVMPPVHLEDPEWSRAVLGLLAAEPPTRARAAAFTLRAEEIEIHFTDRVRRAGAPFQSTTAASWSLRRRSGTLAEQPSTPTVVSASRRSGLVTAWRDEDERCLLDVMACGSVALDGPPVAVGATLSDIVVELATHRWCDLDELLVVGFGDELAGLEHVECLPRIESAHDRLLSTTGEHGARLARCLVVAPPVLRKPSGSLNPLRSLIELAHALGDTAVVCCDPSLGPVRCIWRLASHRNTMDLTFRQATGAQRVIAPGQRRLAAEAPTGLPAEEAECGGETDEDSSATDGGAAPETAGDAGGVDPGTTDPSPPAVLVRVLGPVDIVGSQIPLDRRPRVTELVTYLAFHRDGCSGDAITGALWPARRVSAQTLANRLSEARQALGENVFHHARLRRVSGRHVVSPEVGTDWELFEQLTAAGSGAEMWHRALELVRGRPFEGLAEGDWTLLEGFAPSMSGRVSDVACRLASTRLAEGDATGAEWALRKGLLATPWDERLYRLLMVVHNAAGNRGAVESALRTLGHVLQLEGDPLEGVHPDTAELYLELTREREAE